MSPYDPYSDPFIGSVNNDAIRNMAVAFQSCNLTSSPFDVPVTPIGWEPGLTSSFLLVRLFVPWDIADSHAVWIGLDNMVFDAIFVKQIHSGLSMTAGGESQFELSFSIDFDLCFDKSSFHGMDHCEIADCPSGSLRIQIPSRFTCSRSAGLLS